ncbi:hypothetical protein [Luteolibacter sp. Populi]|uniref:hypothetical protein n=1 Tax=Luteolibacter sp. Populi TaxID=3230487 RepID=UPI003466A478
MNRIPPEPEPPTLKAFPPSILCDERAQAVIDGLRNAVGAAFALLDELTRSRTDGDDWSRLPAPGRAGFPGGRCPVSNFCRSKIIRLIESEKIRDKHVGKARFYSLSDMRRHIRGS